MNSRRKQVQVNLDFRNQLVLIVSREPNNATVVTDVAAYRMINRCLRFVTGSDDEGSSMFTTAIKDCGSRVSAGSKELTTASSMGRAL